MHVGATVCTSVPNITLHIVQGASPLHQICTLVSVLTALRSGVVCTVPCADLQILLSFTNFSISILCFLFRRFIYWFFTGSWIVMFIILDFWHCHNCTSLIYVDLSDLSHLFLMISCLLIKISAGINSVFFAACVLRSTCARGAHTSRLLLHKKMF